MTKKLMALCLGLVLIAGICLSGCGGGDKLVLNVYNWGEYISDGSEGSFDTIREFEIWYEETYGQKVSVNYTTFASNEDMDFRDNHAYLHWLLKPGQGTTWGEMADQKRLESFFVRI